MKVEANASLSYFVNFCNSQGWAQVLPVFGTEPIDEFTRLAERVLRSFPTRCSSRASSSSTATTAHRLLHNQAATALQRQVPSAQHADGHLPMKLSA